MAFVLSTASVYYAQKRGALEKLKSIYEVVLVGRNFTQLVKERKTPVVVSTIEATEIQKKLGNREFPEIMKSTIFVYVTKVGVRYGDSRINIRGFDAINIAVIINVRPVNYIQNVAV